MSACLLTPGKNCSIAATISVGDAEAVHFIALAMALVKPWMTSGFSLMYLSVAMNEV